MTDANLERECEEHLSWLWQSHKSHAARKFRSFGKNPDTAMRALQKRVEASFNARREKVGDEGIASDLMLSWVPADVMRSGLQEMPARIAADRAALDAHEVDRELAELFKRAANRTPGSPVLIAPLPCRQGQRLMHISARLFDLDRLRGEQRARAALSLFGTAFESLYVPWLLRLWILSDLSDGAPKAAPSMIGSVAAQIRTRVSSELLLEDAVHIRNAAFHDRATYDADSRTLKLSDCKWAGTFRAQDIEVIIAATLLLQESLGRVVAWFFFHTTYESGLSAATVDLLLALRNSVQPDPFQVAEMKAAEERMFEPTRRFILSVPKYDAFLRLRACDQPLFRY